MNKNICHFKKLSEQTVCQKIGKFPENGLFPKNVSTIFITLRLRYDLRLENL